MKIFSSRTRAPSGEKRSLLASRLPWLEAFATLLAGLALYFPLKSPDLAKLTWVLGGIQALGKLAYEARLQRELEPVNKLAEIVDLSQKNAISEISALGQVYLRVTEPEFRTVKDIIVRDALHELLSLANEKTSAPLASGEYYRWLLPIIETSSNGSRIWALSTMMDSEWDDSPTERRFLESSLAAAKRGVTIERIFIMKRAGLAKAGSNPAVKAHFREESPSKIKGYFVERDYLKKNDPGLFGRMGDGFIVFDSRVALIDIASPDGLARGQVTMSEAEISRLNRLFEQLKVHSDELKREMLGP